MYNLQLSRKALKIIWEKTIKNRRGLDLKKVNRDELKIKFEGKEAVIEE